MSATILPILQDIDFLFTQQDKLLNLNKLHLGAADRRAVGAPLTSSSSANRCSSTPGFSRSLSARCAAGFPLGDAPTLPAAVAMVNKENAFLLQEVLQQRAGSQVNSARYKTELCRPFEENGACKYGDKCQFAHGYRELRSLCRHPKYKTEPCRTFHTIGYCPYGPRCHFIHNADERRLPAASQLGAGGQRQRPALHHSVSFAGFSGRGGCDWATADGDGDGDLPGPVSRTPPPRSSCPFSLYEDAPPPGFSSPGQGLEALLAPLVSGGRSGDCFYGAKLSPPPPPSSPPPPPPLHQTLSLRRLSQSPGFDRAPSPPDSMSDRDSYVSGSESPTPDSGRRLPIFSRLSISDD